MKKITILCCGQSSETTLGESAKREITNIVDFLPQHFQKLGIEEISILSSSGPSAIQTAEIIADAFTCDLTTTGVLSSLVELEAVFTLIEEQTQEGVLLVMALEHIQPLLEFLCIKSGNRHFMAIYRPEVRSIVTIDFKNQCYYAAGNIVFTLNV
jgi:phosphohistidine phosphatase SixA